MMFGGKDVKRWLSELRGKDMAEAFAWSYKRRYKTGYVWQDLLDEDLITPISDNEYVLKGSEISATTTSTDNDDCSYNEKKALTHQGEANQHRHSSKAKTQEHQKNPLTEKSTEIEQDSPPCISETSTVTDESTKNEEHEEKAFRKTKENEQTDQVDNTRLYSTLLNKNKNKKNDRDNNSKASTDTYKKGRSYSIGASNMLRNIITCGAIETNDSAMVKVNGHSKASLSACTHKIIGNTPHIRKGEELGGSERISGNDIFNLKHQSARKSWDGVKISRKNNSDDTKSGFMSKQKPVSSAAFRPLYVPNCSQCGKSFKPEKLHQHMKSCKGTKAFLAKSPIPTSTSTNYADETSVSTYLLKY
ncbi:hypothetical protein LguiA_019408 [Lonicera macranthoides]